MRGIHILLAVVLSATLAGCVSGQEDAQDNDETEPTTEPVDPHAGHDMSADRNVSVEVSLSGAYPVNIAYDPATITVDNHSRVELTFTNSDTNPVATHDWVLEGVDGGATEVIGNGEESTITFDAPQPGTYTFFCSVPGHRDNGMEGEFTVTA